MERYGIRRSDGRYLARDLSGSKASYFWTSEPDNAATCGHKTDALQVLALLKNTTEFALEVVPLPTEKDETSVQ
jgi:hypothetical protein